MLPLIWLSLVKISFRREPNATSLDGYLIEGGALGIDPVVVAKSNIIPYFFLLIETAKKSGNSVAGVPMFCPSNEWHTKVCGGS